MHDTLGTLAVAANFHIFIVLSTLGSFVPAQQHLLVGGGINFIELDQIGSPTHRQDSKLHCQKV